MGEAGSLWEKFKLKMWTNQASDLQLLTSDLLQVLSLQRLASLECLSLQCIRWELCAPLLRVIVETQPTIRKLSLDVLLPYVPFACKAELAGLTSALVRFEEVDLSGCDFRYMGADELGSVYWKDDTGDILTALLTEPSFDSKLRILTFCGDERKFSKVVTERVVVNWVHFDKSFIVKWMNFDFDNLDFDSDSGDDFGASDETDDDAADAFAAIHDQ